MNELVIGIDVGFGNTKTPHSIFSSGVIKHSVMPPLNKRVIENSTGIYSVGHAKNSIQESKTIDESTLVLTEAGIAEELKRKNLTTANIHLGVGVPLTRMGMEKDELISYYTKNRHLAFKYEDVAYNVYILSVNVFPQGYSGIVPYLKSFGTLALVIDIGSWTIDLLPITSGEPDVSRCKSLSLGTITCMQTIDEHLRTVCNGEAGEVYLMEVMMTGTSKTLPTKYLSIVREDLYKYVDDILGQLRALKFNLDTTQLIFIGGGATIIKHFLDSSKYPNASIIDDIYINAKGYEDLISYKIKSGTLR